MKKIGMSWSPYNSYGKYLEKLSEIYDRANDKATYITDKKYDYTIVLGVHSQIVAFTERIWNFFLEVVDKKSNDVICNRMNAENEILMPKINDAILNMTRERAFIGGELMEHGRKCAVQGAQQGLQDIEKRIQNGEIRGEIVFHDLWPHRDGVAYEMVIYKVEKK